MKHLKIIGLAAVAAAALMAFAASSASADVVCTTSGNPCANKITSVVASLSKESANLTDTSGNSFATCTVGEVKGEITAQGKEVNPSGAITSLTWGAKGAGCNTTVDTVKNGKLELRTEGGASAVWASESEVTLVAFGVSCTYGAGTGTKIGTLNTGAGATMTINAIVNKTAGSFLCPSTAKWNGTYAVTNHSSVFITTE
jgi:hypothetical protein